MFCFSFRTPADGGKSCIQNDLPTTNCSPPSSNRPPKLEIGRQSHNQTVRWCLRAPPVQSGSRDCEGGTGWWNHPKGEGGPLRSGSQRMRGARGQSRVGRRGWRRGHLPEVILSQKIKRSGDVVRDTMFLWSLREENIHIKGCLHFPVPWEERFLSEQHFSKAGSVTWLWEVTAALVLYAEWIWHVHFNEHTLQYRKTWMQMKVGCARQQKQPRTNLISGLGRQTKDVAKKARIKIHPSLSKRQSNSQKSSSNTIYQWQDQPLMFSEVNV